MQASWLPSLPLDSKHPLVEARHNEPQRLGFPIEAIWPAFDARRSADDNPQAVSEVLATQLSQLQPQDEPSEVRLDCQGLKLLTMDRFLHWESLVRRLKTPAAQAMNSAESQFLQDAALADCKAQAVSGTVLGTCYYPMY